MAGRRGNNEGTIRKRTDSRWEARITLPDGKKKSFYGKTRQEVARRLTEALRDNEQGLPIVDERQTLGQYLLTWVDTKYKLKPSSVRRYKTVISVHLIPAFGKVALSKFTPSHIQTYFAQKLKQGLASATVHQHHSVLHAALDDAMRLGLVQRNVANMVNVPSAKGRKYVPFSPEEARRFLTAISDDRDEALYILAITTGMREGELLGLSWEHVDLEKKTLQLSQSLQESNEGRRKYMLGKPKTQYSSRNIALSMIAIEALKRHQERQAKECEVLGNEWDNKHNLVFPNRFGRPMDPPTLGSKVFPRFLSQHGLPRIRFHDLRHTAATLLLIQGVNPKIVSEMLGHSNISITLNVYSHVMPHMQSQAADAMDDVFKERGQS